MEILPTVVYPPSFPKERKLDAHALLKPALAAKVSAEPSVTESQLAEYANDILSRNGFPADVSVSLFRAQAS